MKMLIACLAGLVALVFVMPEDAAAQGHGYRNSGKKHYRTYRRPASVGSNGLCQRDTGTPTSQLNFRNKCDTEEFWARTQARGGGRR